MARPSSSAMTDGDFNALLTTRGGLMAALVAFALLRLDGVVSKGAGRLYQRGSSRRWRKTKNPGFVRT
jgi:hypothetical protein